MSSRRTISPMPTTTATSRSERRARAEPSPTGRAPSAVAAVAPLCRPPPAAATCRLPVMLPVCRDLPWSKNRRTRREQPSCHRPPTRLPLYAMRAAGKLCFCAVFLLSSRCCYYYRPPPCVRAGRATRSSLFFMTHVRTEPHRPPQSPGRRFFLPGFPWDLTRIKPDVARSR